MPSSKLASLAFLVICLSSAAALPAAPPPPSAEAAAKAFQAGEWEKAADAYRAIVAAEPANSKAWFNLGIASRQLARYPEAVDAFEHALGAGFPAATATASLAITYSLAGDLDKAFEKLERAVALGMPAQVLQTHPGLAAARQDPRFAPLLAEAEKRAHPCENDPRYRAFDFWVGDWDVYDPSGQQVGSNKIEKLLRGCLLLENWTSAYGMSGKSLNYFDAKAGKWRQNWVDEGGGIVRYEGEVVDGVMHYAGENLSAAGQRLLSRVTLTPRPDGNVHHVIETSADDGKTWTASFDGLYVPSGKQPPRGD